MKEFRSYWKKNKRWIGISFSFAVIFTVILMLYDISADTVWYAFALCFSVEVILLAVDFVKYYGKCKRMEEQYLNINICVPEDGEPEDLVERYYQEMVNTLFEGKAKIESDNNIARKEMLDYYSLWVHQIKTPIAAMRILLQSAYHRFVRFYSSSRSLSQKTPVLLPDKPLFFFLCYSSYFSLLL